MTHSTEARPTAVFSTVYGQQDNLGDSVLRRGLLDTVRSEETRLHLYVGDCSEDFISALRLQPEDVRYSDRAEWRRSLLRSAAKREAAYLFNAGESGSRRRYVSWGTAALLAAVRLSGGGVIQAGVGLRHPYSVRGPNLTSVLLLTTLVTWRDAVSATSAGKGSVTPDWAFALDNETELRGRNLISVSMRGDRTPPTEHWFRVLRALADEHQAELLVVSQVRRDNDRAREIAVALDCDVNLWTVDETHAARESRVRAIYGASLAVVSDRLHALIIGATEGAQPLGYGSTSLEKLTRTLEPAGFADSCFAPTGESHEHDSYRLSNLIARGDTTTKVEAARLELRRTGQLVRDAMAPRHGVKVS